MTDGVHHQTAGRAEQVHNAMLQLGKARSSYLATVTPQLQGLTQEISKSKQEHKEKTKALESGVGCSLVVFLSIGLTGGLILGSAIANSTGFYEAALLGTVLGAVVGLVFRSINSQSESNKLQATYSQQVAEAEARHAEVEASGDKTLRNAFSQYQNSVSTNIRASNPATMEWNHLVWQNWSPGTAANEVVRVGQILIPILKTNPVPCLLPFPHDRGVLFISNDSNSKQLVSSLHSLLLRMLVAQPPGHLRFTLIDPIGMGQNAALLLPLGDYNPDLISNRAWSEARHIEERLSELSEHMETVIQRYLRTEHATLADYNAHAGEVAEAYRVLVLFDYPTNMTEQSSRRLLSLIKNGPRCGIYTVMTASRQQLARDDGLAYGVLDLDKIRPYTTVVDFGESPRLTYADMVEAYIELDQSPSQEIVNRIITQVGPASVAASNVQVPFERTLPSADQYWTASAQDRLTVPLGPSGARKLQHLTLGQGTAIHALVAGKTGSGKSTLLHTLITNLAYTYSPQEVELYLIDFKKGVEFKTYATHSLPHARVIAIESEREFGLSVLLGLDAELKRRGDIFRAAGVDSLSAFRQSSRSSSQLLPRILLIVDEFQEFFTEDDSLAHQAGQLLDRLVRQGRAFGIHILLGSQTLAGAYNLARGTIDQMAVRIALQCSEADSRLILADDNAAARLLSRPGEAIYNDANGRIEGNSPFQVAWISDEEHKEYLRQLQNLANAKGYRSRHPQIVFEGNAAAHVAKNQLLTNLLTAPAWREPERRVTAWLGDPIAIADPTAAYFRRQSGSNLLIVGQNDEATLGLITTSMISIAAQHAPPTDPEKGVRFYVLDFTPVDSPYAHVLQRLGKRLPHPVKRGQRRDLPDMIAEIATELNRRLSEDAEDAGQQPAIYLVIYGLQRARDLRQEDSMAFSSYGFSGEDTPPPSPAQQLGTILQEGPDLGIHTLIWCDTVTNLNRSLDRRALREFEMRVAFQMSNEDSMTLIDSPAASKLGPYRAVFVSEEEARVEKFRPYDLPTDEWLTWVESALVNKKR